MMNTNDKICNAFNASASHYEKVAQIQHEIGKRLFERLFLLKTQPKYILDIGCGPGSFTTKLKDIYPKAQIVGLDLAFFMLKNGHKKQYWRKKWYPINADMHKLPFANFQFDLIFSNQALHWTLDFASLMEELYRVLAKNGCLMFSTLGPDTFQEINKAFNQVDDYKHVNVFLDMHDIGDILVAKKFLDPVIDMDMITAHYASAKDLFKSIKAQGVVNINPHRNKALTGKGSWNKLLFAMQQFMTNDKQFPLTYEVVYGHAWKGENISSSRDGKVVFSVADLKASMR